MQPGADIQGNKKTSKYFDSFLWPVIHMGESTTNLLQIHKSKPVAEGNHNLMLLEEA